MTAMPFRIGHGFDVHRFAETVDTDTSIRLCGYDVPSPRALIAHSDGDVALHAVCDALLGAIAEGDIGQHFPDTDKQYENVDSRELLKHVFELVQNKHFELGNLDITIVAQSPKLAPYINDMRDVVASLLKASNEQVNIKATTTEKLGYIGREEGIAVHAVVILYKKD